MLADSLPGLQVVLSGDCFLFASDLTGRCGCAGDRLGGFVFDGGAVGLLDGAQAGGDSGLAGGDGLAVAAAVGAFGQALAELLDLAEVGFALVGMGGDGKDHGVRGDGVEDEGDRLGLGVRVSQGSDLGFAGLGPGLPGLGSAVSGLLVAGGEHDVGAVDLVAGGAEVLPDRSEFGSAGDAVLHEPGGFGPVRVVAGTGVDAQLRFERRADRAGFDEADQALGEDRWLRASGEPDGQPPGGDVIDGTVLGVGVGDAGSDELLVLG